MGHHIPHWHISSLEYLLVQILLLHPFQFFVQFDFIQGLADLGAGNGVDNLLAEGVLVS